MGIKDMISTGAMIIIGIIALKAFGGVKGITEMIGGVGDLLGTGAPTAPALGIISPETAAQVAEISGMTLPEVALVAETQEIEGTFDTLQNLSLIAGPLGYIAAPFLLDPIEESYKAESLKKYVSRTAKDEIKVSQVTAPIIPDIIPAEPAGYDDIRPFEVWFRKVQ